jgi:hypothetical protein
MATPEKLWHTNWSSSPQRAGIPKLDMRSHLVLIGAVRTTEHSSPQRATVPPHDGPAAITSPSHTILQGSLRQTAHLSDSPKGAWQSSAVTRSSRHSISRAHDPDTNTYLYSTCGRTFVSHFMAEKFRSTVEMHEDERQQSIRKAWNISGRTCPDTSFPGDAHASDDGIAIVLGTAKLPSSSGSRRVSLHGAPPPELHLVPSYQSSASTLPVNDAPLNIQSSDGSFSRVPGVTRSSTAAITSLLDDPNSSFRKALTIAQHSRHAQQNSTGTSVTDSHYHSFRDPPLTASHASTRPSTPGKLEIRL